MSKQPTSAIRDATTLNEAAANDTPARDSRRRWRRCGWTLLGLAACAAAPLVRFLVSTYLRDVGMLEAHWPPAPVFSKNDRLLILSPHCDDETLGAGGLIATSRAAGAQVKVVFFTNGDGSGSTQIAENIKQRRRTEFQELALMRQREATSAVAQLGVPAQDVLFLGYPDGGLKALWEKHWVADNLYRSPYTGAERSPYNNSYTANAPYCGSQVVDDVAAILAEFRPTAIYTTHPADTHPDHWAAYAYAAAALERTRLEAGKSWAKATQLVTFLVHHGIWPVPHGYHPEQRLAPPASLRDSGTQWLETALTGEERETKKAALEEYVSQMVFTPNYLRAFVRSNELFGRIPVDTVPPSSGLSNVHPEHEKASFSDEAHDTFYNQLWQAGDVRAVELTALAGETPTWKLRLVMASPPSAKLSYTMTVHSFTGTAVRPWRIEIRPAAQVAETQANLIDTISGRRDALTAKIQGNNIDIVVPQQLLASEASPDVLMISASVHFGKSMFDQTPSGVFRLRPPQ